MSFDRGQVVLIPFPFSDLASEKRRPVLLLTATDAFGDFVGVALTTRGHHPRSVALGRGDFNGEPLPKPTWARADKVFSLSARRVVKSVASVTPAAIDRVLTVLCDSVGHGTRTAAG